MWQVYKKELLELVRDKKTMMFVILLPILIFPIIFGLVGFLVANASQKAEQEVHQYVIIGEQFAPEFAQSLHYHKAFNKSTLALDNEAAIIDAIKSEQIALGIIIPEDARQAVHEGRKLKWRVIFNDAASISFIYNRIQELTKDYADLVRSAEFELLGIDANKKAALLNPIELEKVDTSDQRENIGEKLGGMIPYMLLPLCLIGAIYPAIDLGAGEKERGTLETLLITPVTRTELVLGKFFTILTTALANTLITVSSFAIWGLVIGSMAKMAKIAEIFKAIGAADFILMALLLLPVAAMFAALALAISIYARSFKEAQNYMGPLNMLMFIPLIAAAMPNMELNASTMLVPIMNVALGIKELVKGTADYTAIGGIALYSSLIAVAFIAFSVRWFRKETVLFR